MEEKTFLPLTPNEFAQLPADQRERYLEAYELWRMEAKFPGIAALTTVLGRIAASLESLHQALVPEPTSRERYQGEKPEPYLEQLIDALHGLFPLERKVSQLEHDLVELHNLQQMFAASATADSQKLHQGLDAVKERLEKLVSWTGADLEV